MTLASCYTTEIGGVDLRSQRYIFLFEFEMKIKQTLVSSGQLNKGVQNSVERLEDGFGKKNNMIKTQSCESVGYAQR